jgi:hypothetical protein
MTVQDIQTFVSQIPTPWIPLHDKFLDAIGHTPHLGRLPYRVCEGKVYRLSAATVAIEYLNSLLRKVRK